MNLSRLPSCRNTTSAIAEKKAFSIDTVSWGLSPSAMEVKPRMSAKRMLTSARRPLPEQLHLAPHHQVRDGGREEPRQLGAGDGLGLDLPGEVGVLQGDGRLGGDAGEDLEVLLAEGVGALAGVEEQDALELALGEERHGHGAADALRDDALAPAEAAVEDGVGGEDRLAGLEHPLEHGVGEHDLLVAAAAVLHRLGNQLALVVDEEDDAVVRGEELEADREDLVQEALLVALQAHLAVELVGDAQLLVVLAERGRRPSAARRDGTRSPRRWAGRAGPGRPGPPAPRRAP
jgi:hypothetical protein